jgi:hypothetical protein
MTAHELITFWKKGLKSEKIQLDYLGYANLVFDDQGEVVVRNEDGRQFPVTYLSENEINLFHIFI